MAQPSYSGRFRRPINRVAELPIEDVLPYILETKDLTDLKKSLRADHLKKSSPVFLSKIERQFFGITLRMHKRKLRCFKEHGIVCVTCGLKGEFFAIEEEMGGGHSLQLYAIRDGREVMLTKDHILPASLAGRSSMTNLQTMCEDCNWQKSNILANLSGDQTSQITFLIAIKKELDLGVDLGHAPSQVFEPLQAYLCNAKFGNAKKKILKRVLDQLRIGIHKGDRPQYTRWLRDEFENTLGHSITTQIKYQEPFGLKEFLQS